MAWIIGIVLTLGGAILAAVTFVFNSSTPLQLGPVPFFGGAALCLIGIIVLVAKAVTTG